MSSNTLYGIVAFLFLVGVGLTYFLVQLRKARKSLAADLKKLKDRFRGVVDADEERERVLIRLAAEQEQLGHDLKGLAHRRESLKDEAKEIVDALKKMKAQLDMYSENVHLLDFGFYEPHYNFESSEGYKEKLDSIRGEQKKMIKERTAAVCRVEWEVEGSKAKGLRMTNQRLRMMLRAFNGESTASIANVRYNNVLVMEKRIEKAHFAINKLSWSMSCELTDKYLGLKIRELHLEHEFRTKRQEEKEEQSRIRAEMREEERAQKEIEKAVKDAEKEQNLYAKALEKARSEVGSAEGKKREALEQEMAELARKLEEANASKERAISRAQLTRSGHVYIISNIGSFGERIYKIGMTRRLDPMDRVKELGDASVPFRFDVHAIIYSDDAPSLEHNLHARFADRRVNKINKRKEFFEVTIEEVAEVVKEHDAKIEVTLVAEAAEYRQSVALAKQQLDEEENESVDEIIPDTITALLADA